MMSAPRKRIKSCSFNMEKLTILGLVDVEFLQKMRASAANLNEKGSPFGQLSGHCHQ